MEVITGTFEYTRADSKTVPGPPKAPNVGGPGGGRRRG